MARLKLKTPINEEEDDFSVDRFKLELEAERNPELIRKYGKLLKEASAKVKDTKRILQYVETECAERIRRNPKEYGISDKPTKDVCFGLAQAEKDYCDAFDEYLNALKEEEDYKSAVDTCRQRGMMIKILAELWLNSYYAKIIVSDNPEVRKRKFKRLDIDEE